MGDESDDELNDASCILLQELGFVRDRYFSAWLARRGARPTGGDVTPAQLATASRCQERSGVFFPLIQELLRSRREARRLVTADGGVEFHPGHGEWITILGASGFAIDDLLEIYAPPGATDHPYYQLATAD